MNINLIRPNVATTWKMLWLLMGIYYCYYLRLVSKCVCVASKAPPELDYPPPCAPPVESPLPPDCNTEFRSS